MPLSYDCFENIPPALPANIKDFIYSKIFSLFLIEGKTKFTKNEVDSWIKEYNEIQKLIG